MDLEPSFLAQSSCSTDFVLIEDPNLSALLRTALQLYIVDLPSTPRAILVAEASLALVFYDHMTIPLDTLPDRPRVGWPRVRVALGSIRLALTALVAHGMSIAPCDSLKELIDRIESTIASMPSEARPAVLPADIEITPAVTFGQEVDIGYTYMRWLEEMSIQQLRGPSGCTKGWGLLVYTTESVWSQAQRYTIDSAFLSVGAQWWARLLKDTFEGKAPPLRTEMFGKYGLEILATGLSWNDCYEFKVDTVERELQFTMLLELGSRVPEVVEGAMKTNMVSIIANMEACAPLKALMGNTQDSLQLFSWYTQIRDSLRPAMPKWSLDTIKSVALEVQTRTKFCEINEYDSWTDEKKVLYLLEVKSQAAQASQGAGQGSTEGARGDLRDTAYTAKDMYDYHTTEAFEKAVAKLRTVLTSQEVSQSEVVLAVLKLGQWQLNQFICGRIRLEGHAIYGELSPYRLDWGWSDAQLGTVDQEIGALMGRELMRGAITQGQVHPDHEGVTLAGKGVVRMFLEGNLVKLNMENTFLALYYLSLSNYVRKEIPDSQRFMDYQSVDDLIKRMGSVFAMFGCGDDAQDNSFASLMEQCKTVANDCLGLSSYEAHALLHGPYGIRKILDDALNNAGARLRKLFNNKDKKYPPIENAFITGTDLFFLKRLEVQREATAELRKRERVFGVARSAGTPSL